MTPSARLQAAIELIDRLEETAQPADLVLRSFFRARRYAGSKDRAAIAERVYAILRQRATFAWRLGNRGARSLVLGSLLAEGLPPAGIAALFDGSAYGPAPLGEDERRALDGPPPGAAPPHVVGEYPAWLEPDLVRAFGADLPAAMAAMTRRAAIDVRVNTLKATREAVAEALAALGFAAEPTPFAPHGLRLPPGEGSAKLGASKPCADGAFEFQDEAAQVAVQLCGAAPGLRVLDLAAGTGGKTLALAAEMQNRGTLVACDIAQTRLRQLALRAERAGAKVEIDATPKGHFDVVLVDAPCSGTGTWRRQPELRWRLSQARLAELTAIQDHLLERAAGLVAPGGRLVYATCSMLGCENQDRIDGFLARHAGFVSFPAAEAWGGPAMPGMGRYFLAAPHISGTDGFFAAVLQAGN